MHMASTDSLGMETLEAHPQTMHTPMSAKNMTLVLENLIVFGPLLFFSIVSSGVSFGLLSCCVVIESLPNASSPPKLASFQRSCFSKRFQRLRCARTIKFGTPGSAKDLRFFFFSLFSLLFSSLTFLCLDVLLLLFRVVDLL